MKVHLSSIPEEQGLSVTFEGKDAPWEGLKGFDFDALPRGEMYVEKVGRDVIVKGNFAAAAWLGCSRCLEPFSLPLNISFRHILRPYDRELEQATELELAPEDLEYGYYEDEIVFLDRLVEEQVVLAIPMKPLCDKDCQGLCPRCGGNRNMTACSCLVNGKGSPFEVLKVLFKEDR